MRYIALPILYIMETQIRKGCKIIKEYCIKSWFEYRLFYIIKVSFSDYPKMVQIVPVWYNRKRGRCRYNNSGLFWCSGEQYEEK